MEKDPSIHLITTYQYRIKDSNQRLKKFLFEQSGWVNFVWNYCNDLQQQAVKRHDRWFNALDLKKYTSGSSV